MMTADLGRRQRVMWLGLTAVLFLMSGTRGALFAALLTAWAGTLLAATSGTYVKPVQYKIAGWASRCRGIGPVGHLFLWTGPRGWGHRLAASRTNCQG